MHKALTLLLVAAVLPGCGDPDAGALFADIQFATRCEETLGCSGVENRDICGINRSTPCVEEAPQASLSCSVTETDTSRVLNFSASQSGIAISLSQVVVPVGGGNGSGGNCRVRVTAGANTYEGACGSNTPSEAQPCQISNVRFYDNEGNAEFEGDILCASLPNRTQPSLHIELSAPGTGPTAEMTPGTFRMANCDGLTLP